MIWKILDINDNDFHHLGKSQISAGAMDYFSSSKPHSGRLCIAFDNQLFIIFLEHQIPDSLYAPGESFFFAIAAL